MSGSTTDWVSRKRTGPIRTDAARPETPAGSGIARAGTLAGLGAGPPFAGWMFDTFHGYRNAWLVLSVVAFLAVVIMATTPRKLSRSSSIEHGQ